MTGCAFALFDTPIGRCAIAWRGGLVVGFGLPETSPDRLRAGMVRRFPGVLEASPSALAKSAIAAVSRLLAGETEDLRSVPVDLSALPEWDRRVLEHIRSVEAGETRTYGEIALALGSQGAARAVGRALGRNPIPVIIPCHRVLAAHGGSGGFSAPGGVTTKIRILEIERARRTAEPQLFDRLPFAVRPRRA